MLNFEFLKSREEIIPTEVDSILKTGRAILLNGNVRDARAGINFIQFKTNVIRFIYQTPENELKKMLQEKTQTLCLGCQYGLKTDFVCRCDKDLETFVLCDYIRRTIS